MNHNNAESSENAGAMRQRLVLVTGASGFLGRAIVRRLLATGSKVRALVRPTSDLEPFAGMPIDFITGDVADPASVERAIRGVNSVVHAAADTDGTDEGGQTVTLGGTANILAACKAAHVSRLVYISSCSVYQTYGVAPQSMLDETSPLESQPDARGPYSSYKLAAERLVTAAMAGGGIDAVCLRPGAIYGKGTNLFPPIIGYSIADKLFVVIGNGKMVLPLVHVDNVADAVRCCLQTESVKSPIYNVVDPEHVSKRAYIDSLIRRIYPRARVLYIPYGLIRLAVQLEERLFRALGKNPFLTSYRLESSQAPLVIDGAKIIRDFDWQPPENFDDAARRW